MMNKNIISEREKYSYGYAKLLNRPYKEREKEFDIKFEQGKYYIIRFDGKSMTSDYKIKHCSMNKLFFDTMEETFNNFCNQYKKIIFAYSFSDEISVLIKSKRKDKDEVRVEKVLSLWASTLSVLFYKAAVKNKLILKTLPLFDARIIRVEKNEISKYFIARQAFAIDKYLMQLKSEFRIDYKLHTSEEVVKELNKIGVNYDSLPEKYKYGLIFSNKKPDQFVFEFNNNRELLSNLIF